MARDPHDLEGPNLRRLGDRLAEVPSGDEMQARVLRGVRAAVKRREQRQRHLRSMAVFVAVVALGSPAFARFAAHYDITWPAVTRLFRDATPVRKKVPQRNRTHVPVVAERSESPAINEVVSVRVEAPEVKRRVGILKTPAKRVALKTESPFTTLPDAPSKIGVTPPKAEVRPDTVPQIVAAQDPAPQVAGPHPFVATTTPPPTTFPLPRAPSSTPRAAPGFHLRPFTIAPAAQNPALRAQLETYRAALATRARDPNSAIEQLRMLRTKHPSTPLLHEVDIHIIEMLTGAQRWDEARVEAARFMKLHPNSPRIAAVRALIDRVR